MGRHKHETPKANTTIRALPADYAAIERICQNSFLWKRKKKLTTISDTICFCVHFVDQNFKEVSEAVDIGDHGE